MGRKEAMKLKTRGAMDTFKIEDQTHKYRDKDIVTKALTQGKKKRRA